MNLMRTVAIIQARMGSTRLPGKMMLPLGEKETISRVIDRTNQATTVDEVIVATSNKDPDLVLVDRAQRYGASTFSGDEGDVLGRMLNAAHEAQADIIVRIAGDCPVVSPEIIDYAVETLQQSGADYVSNKINRSFPLGLDVEVFTKESFIHVDQMADRPNEREHVTVCYLDHPNEFTRRNISSDEIFSFSQYQNRTDIELVLDEAADFFHLDRIYRGLSRNETDVRSVIDHIDRNDLMENLGNVARKSNKSTEKDETA